MLSGHDDPHTPPGGGENDELSPPASILCPHCAATNAPAADFCVRCGAPLSVIASTDPLRASLLVGFLYREAVHGRPKRIVVLGVWLIFLPGVASLPIAWGNGLTDPNLLAKQAVWSLLSAVIPVLATLNYVRKRREAVPLEDETPA